MNRHPYLKAFICVLLGELLISACISPPQPAAVPAATIPPTAAAPPTALPATATATITATPIPPKPTSTPTAMPPTATLDPLMGRIEGKLTRSDTSQAFAGITVLLRDDSYKELLSTSTDAQGYYIFPAIKPGKYGVSVELTFTHPVLSGCKTLKQTGTDWLFATRVTKGQVELTGVDALTINVAAGEIVEKSLTLTCE
jgi:hypothetical protein